MIVYLNIIFTAIIMPTMMMIMIGYQKMMMMTMMTLMTVLIFISYPVVMAFGVPESSRVNWVNRNVM